MTLFASTLYPQTNPTNPILLDIRGHAPGYERDWSKLLRHYNLVIHSAGQYYTQEWARVTDEHQIDHARRVLARLAALSG